ncbi:putative transcription factor interactor and regulator CCHC(Zn) family [Helianthus annuus]|nr:putative transcription factor interactor and regulator CCHC(Zn) family [Helianthus annuus]
MMNANGFFFFKFKDESGMLNVVKDGPWIIRSQPLFLNNWTPTTKLEKKEVKTVQIWVKIHEVPLAAYTEDGLSLIATTIGEPKMLDSFTTSMCMDAWGRSRYARALIEVSAEKELREEITMAIPEPEGDGFIKETMYVEYEWSPHRCATCCVFGHSVETCPKQPVILRKPVQEVLNRNTQKQPTKRYPTMDQDGYIGVYGKKAAKRVGVPVNKQKPKFEYRPVGPKPRSDNNRASSSKAVKSSNPFDILNDVDADTGETKTGSRLDDEDDDEVEEVYNEMDEFMTRGSKKTNTGASTPDQEVHND